MQFFLFQVMFLPVMEQNFFFIFESRIQYKKKHVLLFVGPIIELERTKFILSCACLNH